MLFKSCLWLVFSFSLLFVGIGKVSAEPPFDLDYSLFVGVEVVKYEIWVEPVDGPAYVYATCNTRDQAGFRLFRMRDGTWIADSSAAWIREVEHTRWVFWRTYETYWDVLDAADIFSRAGFETKIKPVFGGLYPSLSRA